MTGPPDERRAADLRLTVVAALATTLATLALTPVFTRRHWLVAALITIVAVAAVGAGARALAISRWLVLVAQTAALVVVVSALFEPQSAILGLVPTPTTLRALGDLLSSGATSINQQSVPVLDVPGIVLLVTIGIGIVAIEVDFTAVACRCPAISGVVLLAVYGVPSVVLRDGTPWGWFVLAASGWLLLLYVSRREAVHAWGRVLTADRGAPAAGLRAGDPRTALGWRIAAASLAGGLVLAALMPGLGEGVVGRFGPHTGGGDAFASSSPVRLDLTATLERNLTSRSDTPLLTYQSDDGLPQYLRLAVLNDFDGVAWTPAPFPSYAPPVTLGRQAVSGLAAPDATTPVRQTQIHTTGAAGGLNYLPAPYTAVQVEDLSSAWRWDTATSTVFSRTNQIANTTYQVTSQVSTPTAAELAAHATATAAPAGSRTLPGGLPPSLAETAVDVTKGATTDYAKAVRLQGWFRANFTYSLDAKPVDSADALTSFLTDRSGYCQQFAATFALMARSLGIPTRVVVGFTTGTPSGSGIYTVGTHDFHAWPEVWFDDVGWVRFEPTPRADAGSNIDLPTYTQPGPLAPATIPTAAPTAQPAPSTAPSAVTPRRPVSEPVATGTSSSWAGSDRPLGVLGVLVVLVLAAGPGVARALRRRRRLSRPPSRTGVEAAWAELADTARDLGIPWAEADTPRRAGDALVRVAQLEGAPAVGVQRLRHDVEQVRYAQRTAVTDDPAALVREVREELLVRSSRRARWAALVMPRTMLRRGSGRGQ